MRASSIRANPLLFLKGSAYNKNMRDLEKPIKAPEKKAEQKELPQLKILIVDLATSPLALAQRQVMNQMLSTKNTEIISDRKELNQALAQVNFDVLLFNQADRQTIKDITKVRNNPNIEHQPLIVLHSIPDRETKKVMDAGADVHLPPSDFLVSMLSQYASIPELLGSLEDRYGDKMVKGKKGFYRAFKDKLAARSEVTADLAKELKILEEIFQTTNCQDILDGGGGEGRIAIPLAKKGYRVTNFDNSQELIEKMQAKNDQVKGVVGDLRDLPFENESFDAITYNWHVFCDLLGNKSKRQVLAEAFRTLRRNGVIVLDIPDRNRYEEEVELVKGVSPRLFSNPDQMTKAMKNLEAEIAQEDNMLARSIYLQGINILARQF
jgi:SAM-dependent methyltransferase